MPTDQRLRLLVVEDDPLAFAALRLALPDGWRVTHVEDVRSVPTASVIQRYHAAMVDLHLSKSHAAEGLDVIRTIRQANPHLEVVAMSGDLDRSRMEQALKAGASRFLAKPLTTDEVHLVLGKVESLILMRLAAQRQSATESVWRGSSSASDLLRVAIANLRGESGPVLITGESGVGKEVVAQCLHAQEPSPRPMMSVNVAAIPENLFESEFFGHVKGAFTGADANKIGLLEAAHQGDLFLDEVEAMPMNQQAKLLRFLESGELRRVGARESMRISTRVIAATNRRLEELVEKGQFREDLLFRLAGHRIDISPLRERPDDIPDLAESFLSRSKSRRLTLEPDALKALKEYGWPGNTRELKRTCERLTVSSPLPLVRGEDVRALLNPVSRAGSASGVSLDLSRGLGPLLEHLEREAIRSALAREDGDIDRTVALLQISRSSLYKKIKDFGLNAREESST